MIERMDRFENSYIGVGRCGDLASMLIEITSLSFQQRVFFP